MVAPGSQPSSRRAVRRVRTPLRRGFLLELSASTRLCGRGPRAGHIASGRRAPDPARFRATRRPVATIPFPSTTPTIHPTGALFEPRIRRVARDREKTDARDVALLRLKHVEGARSQGRSRRENPDLRDNFEEARGSEHRRSTSSRRAELRSIAADDGKGASLNSKQGA